MAQTHFDIEIKRGSGSCKNGWAAGLYTGKWDEGLRFATMTDAMYLNQDEQEYRVGFLKGVAFSKSGPPCDCAVVSLRESAAGWRLSVTSLTPNIFGRVSASTLSGPGPGPTPGFGWG